MIGSLGVALVVFILAAVVIAAAGTYLARTADALADSTGLGEAVVGAFVLGAATSLPDFAATLSAAIDQRAELAMSNVMGSMAVNLAFLGLADLVYRKANLEHAAASSANLLQAGLMVALLALPLIAMAAPETSWLGIHPATALIAAGYLFGLRLVRGAHHRPMWFPRRTPETVDDLPAPRRARPSVPRLWVVFLSLSALTGAAGWVLMEAAKVLADRTALSDGVAGGLLTAIATSTPELVVTIAAVRAGALTLAVSNIFGTNCFNTLVIAAADIGYREGSIYHAISPLQSMWGLVAVLMGAILLVGMIRRETAGIARIGSESALMLGVYVATAGVVVATG